MKQPEMSMTSKVSIHAPAKGATAFAYFGKSSLLGFNPRSREGSDG